MRPHGFLAHRIARQPGQMAGHMAGHKPLPPMEMTMPLSLVTVTEDATVVEEAAPLWTNRGVVPATGTGQWDQLRAAGRG